MCDCIAFARRHGASKRARLEEGPPSATVTTMLSDIGRGSLGPGHANVLALNMLEDGLHLPAVRDFGSLGNWGKYPANVERDLHRWVVFRITLYVANSSPRGQIAF
jgi:hypothetical protein